MAYLSAIFLWLVVVQSATLVQYGIFTEELFIKQLLPYWRHQSVQLHQHKEKHLLTELLDKIEADTFELDFCNESTFKMLLNTAIAAVQIKYKLKVIVTTSKEELSQHKSNIGSEDLILYIGTSAALQYVTFYLLWFILTNMIRPLQRCMGKLVLGVM